MKILAHPFRHSTAPVEYVFLWIVRCAVMDNLKGFGLKKCLAWVFVAMSQSINPSPGGQTQHETIGFFWFVTEMLIVSSSTFLNDCKTFQPVFWSAKSDYGGIPKPVFLPFISCIQVLLLPHWSALSWGVRIFVADLLGPLFDFPFPLSFSRSRPAGGNRKSQVTFHGGLPCRAQTLTIDKMRKEIRRTDLPNLSGRARAFKDESCTPNRRSGAHAFLRRLAGGAKQWTNWKGGNTPLSSLLWQQDTRQHWATLSEGIIFQLWVQFWIQGMSTFTFECLSFRESWWF